MTEYVVDFGDEKSSAFVRLAMAQAEANGARLCEEIVRCRDCKHARHYHPIDWRTGKPHETVEEWYCEWHSNAEGASEIEPNGYCAWASRKESE